jgi:glycine/D-amino acid oxidase-like deaminating enzyme
MGGHTTPLEVARKQIRLYDVGLRWLEQLVRDHRIDCSWNPVGKFHAAASDSGVENLSASALIRGLADSLPANVVLVENEPVVELSESSPFRIATSEAGYVADRVILANNGFAKALGILRDRLITIFTYAAVTPQLPESELKKLGDTPEWVSYRPIVWARHCAVSRTVDSWCAAPIHTSASSYPPIRWLSSRAAISAAIRI